MISVLTILLILAVTGFVLVLGLYTRAKLQLSKTTRDRDLALDHLETVRGFLYGLSTASLPGVSDAAIRTLDYIDTERRST